MLGGCKGDFLQPKFLLTLKKLVFVLHRQLYKGLIIHVVTNTSRRRLDEEHMISKWSQHDPLN